MAVACRHVLRIFVFVTNVLVFFSGMGLALCAIIFFASSEVRDRVKEKVFDNETMQDLVVAQINDLKIPFIVMAVLGGLLVFASLFACWGALAAHTCLLRGYTGIMSLLLSIQISLGIFVALNKDALLAKSKEKIAKTTNEFAENGNGNRTDEDLCNYLDKLQTEHKCCGITGDVFKTCGDRGNSCPSGTKGKSCVDGVVNELMHHYRWMLYGVIFGLLAFEIISVVVVSVLICMIERHEDEKDAVTAVQVVKSTKQPASVKQPGSAKQTA